jgi:hypothetical protein
VAEQWPKSLGPLAVMSNEKSGEFGETPTSVGAIPSQAGKGFSSPEGVETSG